MIAEAMKSVKPAAAKSILKMQEEIENHARAFGLDFFPLLLEVVSYQQMNEVAAFEGFPTRYFHWRFGMEYERLSKTHDYGLSRIYELVINNNPAVAYLLEGNTPVDQKLVIAHVYGHVDFFKNNFAFSSTNQGMEPEHNTPIRKWIDTMANHASIVRKWINRVGVEKVETFIDACLSIDNLIDPQKPFTPRAEKKKIRNESDDFVEQEVPLLPVDKDYMQSFINPDEFVEAQKKKLVDEEERSKHFPENPERDVMQFVIEHAPLERWEREILTIVRAESYYFLPQRQTKIMNEGWATYWHSKLMTEKICDAGEIVDYADRCASVLQTSQNQINPYKLGVELFRNIRERWDKGQFGREWDDCQDYEAKRNWDRRTGIGKQKIFEVRSLYTDVTFVDEFLTPEFAADQKLYTFGYNERNGRWEIESRKFQEVKSKMLTQLTNSGNPVISVIDANHANRSELLLKHDHQGVDLRIDWVEPVLRSLFRMWSKPIVLQSVVDNQATTLRFDGSGIEKKALK